MTSLWVPLGIETAESQLLLTPDDAKSSLQRLNLSELIIRSISSTRTSLEYTLQRGCVVVRAREGEELRGLLQHSIIPALPGRAPAVEPRRNSVSVIS